jgi:RNA polymerase sigma-70 factor (ECF subfamily)
MLEDKWLLWNFKRGSTRALERIYEKYEAYLITVATALLNNTQAAEDVLHDFFVSFVQSADRIKLNGSLKAYMAVCVANLARNKLKKSRREPLGLEEDCQVASPDWPPELSAMQQEQTAILNRVLSQLPYEQKEVIVLHLQGNMKFAQIANLQSTSVNTVQSRYRYGLEKLRTLLNSEVMP